ncbi:hypothetical protein E2P81_ATG11022 [Venturia nashicola]|uniref:cutinase n=1 Tax=Venturia nashicola TaxID=86259 RepID=A0A4Z1P7N7_9PEZI|nr:hypothetical protein E6O75_ATG10698 [Venturia nashicola]TLD27734.1 hypothetical protein E2P81_ATG11022 [Venturia nashicola]
MRSAIVVSLLAILSNVQAQKCQGQSCYVASLSGSTEEPYKLQGGKKPTGGNAIGDRCIKGWYSKLGLPAPAGLKRTALESYNEFMEATITPEAKEALQSRALEDQENVTADACTPYILLYARGTTEVGELGATVGPALKAGLATDKNWSVRGISSRDGYDASLNGIYCIGMDGGMACKGILEKMVAQCPNSKFVTSGYSQGAMVARICVAYASEAAKKKVIAILNYGDPFNGATVKGFDQSKIKVNCNPTDGVCKGDFSIGVGHLSYSTSSGVAWLKSLEKGG